MHTQTFVCSVAALFAVAVSAASADPVTLINHDEFLEIKGPNSIYYTKEGGTTKWIGVNREYLTFIESTRTTGGVTTTLTTGAPGVVVTATALNEDGDIHISLSPAVVDILNNISEEAVEACGGRKRKRQSCDLNLEFATRLQKELRSGGRLAKFNLNFLPEIAAPDVAAVVAKLTGPVPKALGCILAAWLLERAFHSDNNGAPKIPPAFNIPANVVGPTATTPDPTSTTTGCPKNAPTGLKRPRCPSIHCRGNNEAPKGTKLVCSEGKWKGCECMREAVAIAQVGDVNKYDDDKTWYELQQEFLLNLLEWKEESPWCIPGQNPSSDKVPTSFCQCGEDRNEFYPMANKTSTPYDPCPWTEAPGPTLIFSEKATTTTTDTQITGTPECANASEDISIYASREEAEKRRDEFCKENNNRVITEDDPVGDQYKDTHEYIEGRKAEFQIEAYAGRNCGQQKIVESDCKEALSLLFDECRTKFNSKRILGGDLTHRCQKYALNAKPYNQDHVDSHVGAVECFPTHGSSDADKVVSIAITNNTIDYFCKGTEPNWRQVIATDPSEPYSNNYYNSTLTMTSDAPPLCKKLYTEDGKENADVQSFCKSPLMAIVKKCVYNGGKVTSDCGEWTLQSCPLGGVCKIGEPGKHS